MTAVRYDGWIPIRAYCRDGWNIEWLYLGKGSFADPFFLSTIQRELQTPFNALFRRRTPISELIRWREVAPGIAPSGFIFHMSRCGSTVITRMLAQSPRHLVLSEPEPLSMLAALPPGPGYLDLLRGMLSALAQPASQQTRLFVKFDARDFFYLPLLQQAWPGVPWIFLYRDPVEVLVSVAGAMQWTLREPPPWTGYSADPAWPPDERAAAFLGALLERSASAFPNPLGLLVNYTQLPAAVPREIAAHFKLDIAPEELAAMENASSFHAKRPGERFTPDRDAKARAASPRIRELAARWIAPHFASLERLRLS